MSRFIFIILLLLVVFMAISNPTKEEFIDHYETQYVSQSKTVLEELFSRVTKPVAGTLADQATRHNYVIFSIYDMGGYGVYIGAFGNFSRLE